MAAYHQKPYKPVRKAPPRPSTGDHADVRTSGRVKSIVEPKIMWPGIQTEDQVRSGLSIANGVNHPEWDGFSLPSKDAIAYMKALQGPGGPFFGRAFERSIENHKKFFFEGARLIGAYADLFEWWRRLLLSRGGRAMVLPFPLEDAGEPYFTPPDQRFVQQVGNLYIYGSSKYPEAQPNVYVRKK